MARRRLDEIGEIVGFDVEGAGIVQDARQLLVVERAVDQRHDGEILHGLAGELGLALERRDQVARLDGGQGAHVREVGTAQQVAPRGAHACRVCLGQRLAAGQRHLAHGAQDGVALAMADVLASVASFAHEKVLLAEECNRAASSCKRSIPNTAIPPSKRCASKSRAPRRRLREQYLSRSRCFGFPNITYLGRMAPTYSDPWPPSSHRLLKFFSICT